MTNSKKQIVLALLFLVATLFAVSYYLNVKQEVYRSAVIEKLTEQETTMLRFSELLARGSVDSVVNQLVVDCVLEERERFDFLLSNLGELSRAELVEVDALFSACGSYFADRQAVLAARFQREVNVYEDYISFLELINHKPHDYNNRLQAWQRYTQDEHEKSVLVSQIVVIQGEIIDLLIAGETIGSQAINVKLEEAQAAKDTLSVLGAKTNELQEEIIKP